VNSMTGSINYYDEALLSEINFFVSGPIVRPLEVIKCCSIAMTYDLDIRKGGTVEHRV
jgi:hypothetical protein